MQWVQDTDRNNVHNLYNVRHEANRHFRNKKKEYLRIKIDEIETNSKITNIGASMMLRRVTGLELIE
jgi:hypothetical protein